VAQPDCPPPSFPPTVTLLEARLAPIHCPEMSVRPPHAPPVTAAVTAAKDSVPPPMPGAFLSGCPRPPSGRVLCPVWHHAIAPSRVSVTHPPLRLATSCGRPSGAPQH